MDLAEIEKIFTYQVPKEGQPEKYNLIREKAKTLAKQINAACPDSEEKTLAIEKLRESVMWANASIACRE